MWQKVQVRDNVVTERVHSIESLQISDDGKSMSGMDTIGFMVEYKKID